MSEHEPETTWPAGLQAPIVALLGAINTATVQAETRNKGVTGINTTVTFLSGIGAGLVGVLGGGATIVTGTAGLFTTVTDNAPAVRAVFVAAAALLGAATVLSVAWIIRSDLQARASAVAARRVSQAEMVAAVLSNYRFAIPPGAPVYSANYAVKTKANAKTWIPVEGFTWQDGHLQAKVAGVPDTITLDDNVVADLVDLRSVLTTGS